MNIGLYFGSFNPIHIGHLIIANHFATHTDLDEIWLVVSPQNPHKAKSTLLADHHRYEMVYLALDPYEKLRPCDIEFKIPKPSYTIHTLVYLKEKYPHKNFHLIMGSDNLNSFHRWKNYEEILKNHHLYIYPRHGQKTNKIPIEKYSLIDAPMIEIAASHIRKLIAQQKETRPLLPPEVWNYIDKMGLYHSLKKYF